MSENQQPALGQRASNNLKDSDYFMAAALLSAKRSEDPNTKVGACIVNQKKKIVGTGYNCMPSSCEGMPWKRDDKNPLNNKHFYVCHAEMNAIMNKNCADVTDCTMYTTLFPCNECAKLIIQAGLKKVVYFSDKYHSRPEMEASRRMLDAANIPHERFMHSEPQNSDHKITIDLICTD